MQSIRSIPKKQERKNRAKTGKHNQKNDVKIDVNDVNHDVKKNHPRFRRRLSKKKYMEINKEYAM